MTTGQMLAEPRPLYCLAKSRGDGGVSLVPNQAWYSLEDARKEIARITEPRDETYCIVQMGAVVQDFYRPKRRDPEE